MNMQRIKLGKLKFVIPLTFIGIGFIGFVTPVSATLISYDFYGDNDCSGYFNGTSPGFANCTIWVNNQTGQRVDLSPIIIKYNTTDTGTGEIEINPLYSGVTADDFTFDPSLSNQKTSGQWTYSQDTGDPDVRFWTAKGSNDFRLFWVVPDSQASTCSSNPYTLACLNLAVPQTTNQWNTTNLNFNSNKGTYSTPGLSHIAFWDTGGTTPPTGIPEPTTAALLGLGMLALGAIRRRKAA